MINVSPSLYSAEGSVSGRRRSGVPMEEVTFPEGDRHQKKRYPESTRTRKFNSGSSESTRAEVGSLDRSYLNTDIKVV